MSACRPPSATHAGQLLPFQPRRRGWEPWLDDATIARHFSVSSRTVRRWRAEGMPSKRLGGARRYRLSDAEAWHERRTAS
jgi:hypothetical protein